MTLIHKQNGAGRQRFQDDAQAISQESRELCFGHLARGHDKVRMNGFAVPIYGHPPSHCVAGRKSPYGPIDRP